LPAALEALPAGRAVNSVAPGTLEVARPAVAAGPRFQYDGAAGATPAFILHGDPMKLTHAVIAAGLLAAGAAQAQDGEALLKKYGCVACHANDKKVVGPAYVEVAAKYKGDAGAAAKLAAKVKAGGTGVWGQIPMPPNPSVSDADMKTMIATILALKK
jgi:cytochrome c